MSDLGLALRVLLICAALVGVAWILVALMRWARRGGKGVHAVGAVVMLFGWGNMRDPRNDTVAEAKDGRVDRGTHSGDPIEPDTQ